MSERNEAIYLYCLASAGALEVVSGCGIDPQQILLTATVDGVVAVYSGVELADFTGPEGESNLQDIHWIGPRALAHEQVVAQISAAAPVLPARFGTIFSTIGRLQQLMTAKHDAFTQFLGQMENRQEWSVKGYVDKKQAIKLQFDAEVAAHSEALDPLAPGSRYFQEKKLEAVAQQAVSVRIQEQVDAIAGELAALVTERVGRKLLSRDATGKEHDMVLNWALLVERDDVARLEAAVQQINRRLAAEAFVLELSGPWPAYSFCPSFSPDTDA